MSATTNQFSLPGGTSKKRFPAVRTACATRLLLLAMPRARRRPRPWRRRFPATSIPMLLLLGGLSIGVPPQVRGQSSTYYFALNPI
ncbi:MAG: hypothetical protein ABSD29_13220, partial [Verrucomicrobiota bacterium]